MSVRAEFTVHASNLAQAKTRADDTARDLMGDVPYELHLEARPQGAGLSGSIKVWQFDVSLVAVEADPHEHPSRIKRGEVPPGLLEQPGTLRGPRINRGPR